MPKLSQYLTSAGHAVAQRQRWENRMREEMQFIVLDNERSQWSTVVTKMSRQMDNFPRWARDLLLNADDEDREETVDRLARTISCAAYNSHVLSRLAAAGIPYKMWVTRHDPLVRPTHQAADGQKQRLSAPFIVANQHLQFPADPTTAHIDVWMNCRCVALGRTTPP